jgi:hypothetical protein
MALAKMTPDERKQLVEEGKALVAPPNVVVDLAERRSEREEARLAALGERVAALEAFMMIHRPKHLSLVPGVLA